jgi:hypothetical protein
MFQRTKMRTGNSALTAMNQVYMKLAVHHVFLLDVRSTCYASLNAYKHQTRRICCPLIAATRSSSHPDVRLTSSNLEKLLSME